jgi:hypothetical protein
LVDVVTNGDVFVTEAAPGSAQLFGKYDSNGNLRGATSFDGLSTVAAYGLDADDRETVVVAGGFDGGIDFGAGRLQSNGASLYVAKYDASAVPSKCLWSRAFGVNVAGASNPSRVAMAPDDGSVYVAGTAKGGIDFGTAKVLPSASGVIYIAKLLP